MDKQTLATETEALLRERFGAGLKETDLNADMPVFILDKGILYEALEFLKNDSRTAYGFLTTMCGLHYPENKEAEFGLMYQLHNLVKNTRIRLKFFMDREDLNVPSITPLWPAANWMERQEYDFFGFHFEGHPDLRRILNMDEMNYFPMRKEYPLEDGSRDDKNDSMFGR